MVPGDELEANPATGTRSGTRSSPSSVARSKKPHHIHDDAILDLRLGLPPAWSSWRSELLAHRRELRE